MKILVIDSSINVNSVSIELINEFLKKFDNIEGIEVDWLKSTEISNSIDGYWSGDYVERLEKADLILIGAPVYNFGMSAGLKSWIDKVVVAGKTFKYIDGQPKGLLENKRVFVFYTSGGVKAGSDFDFLSKHLDFVLNFIGLSDIHYFKSEAMIFDSEIKQKVLEEIKNFRV